MDLFWKKVANGIEFVKEFMAPQGEIKSPTGAAPAGSASPAMARCGIWSVEFQIL